MTRDERLEEEYARQGLMVDFDVCDFINKLYDDLESRTCENCKHSRKIVGCPCCHHGFNCTNKDTNFNDIRLYSDFGCNKFEKADK